MENKIDISKLLKDCPKGMELDSTIYEDVILDNIDNSPEHEYPIRIATKNGYLLNLTKYGTYTDIDEAKCVIFPKGKTTWEGFVPPCQFKDGDIIAMENECGIHIFIYNYTTDEYNSYGYYVVFTSFGKFKINGFCNGSAYRLANEDEKEKLFQAIKANGYKWNEETKTLEKLPKFKVGNKIQYMDYKVKITEVNIEDECYEYESIFAKGIGSISFNEQDNWELVPDAKPIFKAGNIIQHKENSGWVCTIRRVEDRYYVEGHPTCFTIPFDKQNEYELVLNKFDINTLKPFESKVLVRDINTDKWIGAFYSHCKLNGKKFYTIGSSYYYQCIPYEGNEHLLDTTDDCDEYFKNW